MRAHADDHRLVLVRDRLAGVDVPVELRFAGREIRLRLDRIALVLLLRTDPLALCEVAEHVVRPQPLVIIVRQYRGILHLGEGEPGQDLPLHKRNRNIRLPVRIIRTAVVPLLTVS